VKRILIPVFPNVQALDVVGPAEVFSLGTRLGQHEYALELVATSEAAVQASSGMQHVPDRTVGRTRGSVDTLVIPGGEGTRAALNDTALIGWVGRMAARARRVASVCTGAFLLAEAGLLDGRRATTHWSA